MFNLKKMNIMSKEVKIAVPEGYEIDKANSTFECIKFKKKSLTYVDIDNEIIKQRGQGSITARWFKGEESYITLGTYLVGSKPNLERLLALNKLMNAAKYLNQGRPFDHGYHYIYIDRNGDIAVYNTDCKFTMRDGQVFFISYEAAMQAIEILGEDTIKQALGVFE